MQITKKAGIVCIILLMVIIFGQMPFTGCATTSAPREKTPEEIQAEQDSLKREAEAELRRLWSFGLEPYRQGDYRRAVYYFKQVMEKDTFNIYEHHLYSRLGTSYMNLQLPDSAEWTYRLGQERQPDNPWFYESLGYIYRLSNRTEDAIEEYQVLTKLQADSSKWFVTLGELYVQVNELDKAIEAYRSALDIIPDDNALRNTYTMLLESTGDPAVIIKERLVQVQNDPDNVDHRMGLIRAYHNNAMYQESVEHLRFIESKQPENIFAMTLLGDTYQKLEMYNEAARIYTRLIEIDSDNPDHYCNLSYCYTSLGRYQAAMNQANRALRISQGYGRAYMARGFAYQTAADKCIDKKQKENPEKRYPDFNDKLVYLLAQEEYQKAENDTRTRGEARRFVAYLENFIPIAEDYFMNSNRRTPEGDCYLWI